MADNNDLSEQPPHAPAKSRVRRAAARASDDSPPAVGHTREAWENRLRAFEGYSHVFIRAAMAVVIAGLFIYLNIRVMNFIGTVFVADLELLKTSPNGSRVVTPNVLVALISATAAQVGVAVIAIVSYLFPRPKAGKG